MEFDFWFRTNILIRVVLSAMMVVLCVAAIYGILAADKINDTLASQYQTSQPGLSEFLLKEDFTFSIVYFTLMLLIEFLCFIVYFRLYK